MTGVSVNACAHCGADMIAPEWSAYLPDRCVRNVWSCAACGYQFEDTVCFATHEATDPVPISAPFLISSVTTPHLVQQKAPVDRAAGHTAISASGADQT